MWPQINKKNHNKPIMKKFLLLFVLSGMYLEGNGQSTPTETADAKKPMSTNAADTTGRSGKAPMISIGPVVFDFELSRGQTKSQFIYIVNRKDKGYTFHLTIEDFSYDSVNSMVVSPLGTNPNSCGQWISFDKNFVEVGPNSTAKVLMTMSVPDDPEAEKQMKWAIVKVKTSTDNTYEAQGGKDKKIKLAIQPNAGVVIKVHQRPPGAVKDIKMVSFAKLNDSTARIGCENTGKTSVECKVSVELTGTDTDYKETFQREGLHILPGTKRLVDIKLPRTDVPKGKYNAIAIIDAGDDDVPLEASQTTFEIN